MMIDVCRQESEWELYNKWATIRNCVGMIINGRENTTFQ